MVSEGVKEPGGALFVVATPLGNLDDMTFRAVKSLKEVDLIVCEDTRRTGNLLQHFGITRPLLSFFEHNERDRVSEIIDRLARGDRVALVSDAGTPTISDPGFVLVRTARERGIRVTPIPGPSAVIAALSVSGLPTDAFYFAGFLPRAESARRSKIEALRDQRSTLVLYESPHRVLETLDDLVSILGDRPAFLCREVTKLHEELRRATLIELRDELRRRPEILGEIVLVIGGAPEARAVGSMEEALAVFDAEAAMGATPRAAAKEAAKSTGLAARDIYAHAASRTSR